MINTSEQNLQRMKVLSQAIVQVATKMKLQSTELAEILNIDNITAAQLLKHQYLISEHTELWTSAAYFVRFYSLLSQMVGGNEILAIDWIYSVNDNFNQQTPISYIKQGNLTKVYEYLETMANV